MRTTVFNSVKTGLFTDWIWTCHCGKDTCVANNIMMALFYSRAPV